MLKLRMSQDNHNRILVRGVNWIGDAVMTMPALRALKKTYPGSHIALLVKPWVAPLFEKDPSIDEIIPYTEDFGGIAGKFRLASGLGRRGFDAAYLLQNAFGAAAVAFLAGIPERIGYARDGRRLLLTNPVPFDQRAKSLHHIDYYLDLLERSGLPVANAGTLKKMPWIYLSLDERTAARDKLRALKRPVIGLNPGAAYGSSKRWPTDRFAEVGRRIISELRGSVVVFGGPAETGIADEIAEIIDDPFSLLNVAGKTGLRELAALISECDALVTNDSGPMHIGYAVGTPVAAIFGSTSPEHTGPNGFESVVVREKPDCSPCFERECKTGSLQCMELVGAEDVFNAVRRFVKTKRAVFFDRDGTLCRDAHYLSRMEDFEIYPEISALKKLKDRGLLLIGITNQSGIARGLIREDFVRQVNGIFMDSFGFDGFYYCPHHPDEKCSCRKPEPAMLYQARRDFAVDLKNSFMVGDRDPDMLLARAVGARGIFVRTGGVQTSPYADYIAADLDEAVKIILSEQI